MLSSAFPEEKWTLHKKSRGYWTSLQNQKQFMDNLAKYMDIYKKILWTTWSRVHCCNNEPLTKLSKEFSELTFISIKSDKEWQFITYRDIVQFGGRGLLHHYNNSPLQLLQALYPDHPMHKVKPASYSKTQHFLFKQVSSLLGNRSILFNAKCKDWKFPSTKAPFELGIGNNSCSLIFLRRICTLFITWL